MLNQLLHSTRYRLCCTVILLMAFSFLGLSISVKAQDAASDPVVTVEVASTTVWRDAVKTGSVGINCTDKAGNPVPNASVSISISSPGSVTPTSATTDSKGNVTVTVKSTDLSTDNANATVTATSQGVSGTGAVTFNGALEIKNGNTDVTKNRTQSMIGEQQNLTVSLRSGTAITSATWTFGGGGTPILNWQQSNPNNTSASLTTYIPSGGLTGTSASFYVTTVGDATANVSATDSGGTGTASTTINISEPTDFSFAAAENAPVVGTLKIALGSLDASTPGIQFTGSGGSGGTLTAAQIVTTDDLEVTNSSGVQPFTPPNIPGLDNSFPYSNAGGSPSDTPGNTFAKGVTEANKHFVATMYLMWKSNRNGIPVQVESIPWDWEVDVKFDSTTGKPLSGYSHSDANPLIKSTPVSGGVLNWAGTVVNS